MEYGMIPKLDQFTDNQAIETQRVQSSSQSSEVKTRQNLENVQKEEIENSKRGSTAEKVQNEKLSKQKYEVPLTNVNFGFDSASRDFYVKVKRGKVENQYPTEEMMRAKALMMSLQNNSTNSTKI